MSDDVISYESYVTVARGEFDILGPDSTDELNWKWSYCQKFAPIDSWKKIGNCSFLEWDFDWDEEKMKKKGIYGFEGHITVWNIKKVKAKTSSFRFKVNLTKSGQSISKRIGSVGGVAYSVKQPNIRQFKFELELNKVSKIPEPLPFSNLADAVLVVGGQKISVNRNHLSVCSDYFNTLFNSEFTEKSLAENPIENVKYEDFRRLLDVIHPKNPVLPSDENLEILLQLADRFMMPAVTRRVEQHLLIACDTPFAQVLKLADKYKLEKLLDQCVGMFTTADHLRDLKPTFGSRTGSLELSDSTKVKLFNNIIKTIE